MEVKPGYKQTAVGVIPEEWAVRPLLSALRIAQGQVDPRNEPYRSMFLVAPDHIESGTGRLMQRQTASDQAAISGKYLFAARDVIYSKIRPHLRKATLATFEGLCSADMYPLRPAADISPGYLLNVILGERFSRYAESVSVRSGMPKINRQEMAGFSLAVPPLPEQQAIAQALSDVDDLIQSLERLISKKRGLKQAAMQQLLTAQTRLPGFSGEWTNRTLGDVAVLTRDGIQPNKTPDRVFTHYSLPAYDADRRPARELGSEIGSNKFILPEGAVLVSKLNPRIPRVWMPTMLGDRPICSTEFLVLLPKPCIAREYLYVACSARSFGERMELIATGTTGSHQRMNPTDALSISVLCPKSLSEQRAIAEVLSDIDAEIDALEARLTKTRDLKQGMMQELLTGRTRLV